jgi:hypothetical protein
MPVSSQPDEAGWWLAVDGRWYPPESAPQFAPGPQFATAPTPTSAPSSDSTPTPPPRFAAAPTLPSAATATIGPPLGTPGGPVFGRGPAPPLPLPNVQRPAPTSMNSMHTASSPSARNSGEAMAIVSMILGIVALVGTFWIVMAVGYKIGMIVDLTLGLTSFLLGLTARQNGAGGIAIAGITLGAISCSFSILFILDLLMAYAHFGRF